MVLKLFTIVIAVERQFPPSWLYPNMGLLPGGIVPLFTELTAWRQVYKGCFQLRVFHTYVHARKTLNPFQYYI